MRNIYAEFSEKLQEADANCTRLENVGCETSDAAGTYRELMELASR